MTPHKEKKEEKKVPEVEIKEELIMGNGFADSKVFYKKGKKWKLLVHRKI